MNVAPEIYDRTKSPNPSRVAMPSAVVPQLSLREVSLTPSEQPPRSPREEEEFLDWSENQARPRRSLLKLDVGLFALLLILTALLIVGVVELIRHVR